MTLDFVFRTCTGHDTQYWSERGDLDWFEKYADSRQDSGKGVLTANWNHFPRALASDSHQSTEGKSAQDFNWGRGRKFQDILERMGYHLEWSDQTSRCDHCNGCIEETAHCYGDTAHYAVLGECDVVCEECIRKDFAEEYLERLKDNPRAACHIRGINPADYANGGFYPGQNDGPVKISAELQSKGFEHVLFAIDDSGQFDVHFSVWHKREEE